VYPFPSQSGSREASTLTGKIAFVYGMGRFGIASMAGRGSSVEIAAAHPPYVSITSKSPSARRASKWRARFRRLFWEHREVSSHQESMSRYQIVRRVIGMSTPKGRSVSGVGRGGIANTRNLGYPARSAVGHIYASMAEREPSVRHVVADPSVSMVGRDTHARSAAAHPSASMVGVGHRASSAAGHPSAFTTSRGLYARSAEEHPSASMVDKGLCANRAAGHPSVSIIGRGQHARIAVGHPFVSMAGINHSARTAADLRSASITRERLTARSASLSKTLQHCHL
jgi:hypothetical protein